MKKHITGIRHRIVHDHMGLDYDIFREVAIRHTPALNRGLEGIVPSMEG